jgi:uncharacterized membrane protein
MNEKHLANTNQEDDKTLSRREMVGRIGLAGAVPAVVAVVAATTQAHAQSSVTTTTAATTTATTFTTLPFTSSFTTPFNPPPDDLARLRRPHDEEESAAD